MSERWLHDAFISYSTLGNAQLGAALEYALENLGRRWDEPRARDVFRDVSDQPATSDLAGDLLRHLERSRFLVYVVSAQAAASVWVGDELRRWMAVRGTDRLLLVIGGGRLSWDRAAGRFDDASTLPSELRSAFAAEPKWVDLGWTAAGFDPADERFLDAVADLAATIDGVPKEILIGRHRREHRKALARRLADSAINGADSIPDVSLLLSAAASDLDDVPATRRALCDVLEATSSLALLLGTDVPVTAIAAASDAGSFLIGFEDGTIERWSGTERVERHEPGHAVTVTSLTGDLTGHRYAVGYADGTVLLLTDGMVTCRWAPGSSRVEAVALHPDEDIVAAAVGDGRVALLSATVTRMYDDLTRVRAVRFVDGELEIFAWSDLYHANVATGALSQVRRLHVLARPGPMAFSSIGDRSVVCQLDGGGIGIESAGERVTFIQGTRGFLSAVAMDPRGHRVAVAAGGQVSVYDADVGGGPLHVYAMCLQSIRQLVVGEDARWLLALGEARCELRIPQDSTLCRLLMPHVDDIPSVVQRALDVAFSHDGKTVAAITRPGRRSGRPPEVALWSTATGARVGSLVTEPAKSLEFVDNDHLLVVPLDGPPTVHHLPSGAVMVNVAAAPPPERVHVDLLQGRWGLAVRVGDHVVDTIEHPGPVNIVWALSDDGTRLATSTSRGLLTLRDIEVRLDLWSAPMSQVAELKFTPAGDTLAGVTGSGHLRLIDVRTGEITARVKISDAPVHRMRFARDGRYLAIASPGGPVTIVDTDVTSWRMTARNRAGRSLVTAERAAFGLDDVRV